MDAMNPSDIHRKRIVGALLLLFWMAAGRPVLALRSRAGCGCRPANRPSGPRCGSST